MERTGKFYHTDSAPLNHLKQRADLHERIVDGLEKKLGVYLMPLLLDGRRYSVKSKGVEWTDEPEVGSVFAPRRYRVMVSVALLNPHDAEVGEWVDRDAFGAKGLGTNRQHVLVNGEHRTFQFVAGAWQRVS